MLEPLESRTMLTTIPFGPAPLFSPAETLPFYRDGSTIRINGTDAGELIEISDSAGMLNFRLNGSALSDPISRYSITAISIYGYGGDDTLRMLSTASIPVTLDGGGGRDRLLGGLMADLLN